ncbi:MAG TPA: hypothetical protein VN901_26145 [Candidatus Acidoferrales bacterium]|nr:hypothetical protein [Candidatus Acidoferrales bacterium]
MEEPRHSGRRIALNTPTLVVILLVYYLFSHRVALVLAIGWAEVACFVYVPRLWQLRGGS